MLKVKKELKQKALATAISFSIIFLIIFLGHAQAITLSLGNFSNNNPILGEAISTIASIDINSNEFLNIRNITLEVNGAENRSCIFNVSGAAISGCNGISISQISLSSYSYGYGYNFGYGYGYGYGYSQGSLSYNITIFTSNFSTGDYNFTLKIISGSSSSSSIPKELNILTPIAPQPQTEQSEGGGGSPFVNVSNKSSNSANTTQIPLFNNPTFNQLSNPLEENNEDNAEEIENNEQQDVETETTEDKKGFSRITGAVTGLISEPSFWIIAVLIIIIAGSFILIRIRINKYKLDHSQEDRFYP